MLSIFLDNKTEISQSGKSFKLIKDGKSLTEVEMDNVSIRSISRDSYELFWVDKNKKVNVVNVALESGQATIQWQGFSYRIPFETSAQKIHRELSGGAGGDDSLSVKAQMPGKVVKIFVKAGDQVESGQPLVILEAMKMENEIRSTRAGVVEKISVEAGATVTSKQQLLQFRK